MKNKRFCLSSAVIPVLFLLGLFFSADCGKTTQASLEGSYAGVSESEWNVTLTLKKGGVAEIVMSTWAPGQYEKHESEKTAGRWSAKGNVVTLEYKGITERFIYDDNLSLAELGFKGGAPGLKQIRAADEKAIIGYYSLWKLPHKFGN
jgi:hypothetical protein